MSQIIFSFIDLCRLVDRAILLLLSIAFFVDMINGYQVSIAGGSILSVVHKSAVLLLVWSRICLANLRSGIVLISVFSSLFISIAIAFFLHQSQPLLMLDFGYVLKSVLFISVLEYLRLVVLNSKVLCRFGMYALYLNVFFIFLNSALGLMGYGFSAYGGEEAGEGIGVKGFIYSGNELAATILAISSFFLVQWRFFSFVGRGVINLWMAIIAVATATKSASVGMLALMAYTFLRMSELHRWMKLMVVMVSLLLVAIIFAMYVPDKLVEKWNMVIERRGVFSLILSDREKFAFDIYHYFTSQDSFFIWLLGAGRSLLSLSVKESSELDLLDMYFWFGAAGVWVWFLFFGRAFRFVRSYVFDIGCLKVVRFNIIILLVVSLFSGHVVYSGVLSIPFALSLMAIAVRQRELIKNA